MAAIWQARIGPMHRRNTFECDDAARALACPACRASTAARRQTGPRRWYVAVEPMSHTAPAKWPPRSRVGCDHRRHRHRWHLASATPTVHQHLSPHTPTRTAPWGGDGGCAVGLDAVATRRSDNRVACILLTQSLGSEGYTTQVTQSTRDQSDVDNGRHRSSI